MSMKRILIADASKASLVMTSEVFKDHFPGVQVVVARNSNDAIELVKTIGDVDAIVIDYDLPDRDGAQTAARIKKICSTPVLLTGFDRPEVGDNIEKELAAYDDCLSWMRKPVNPDLVVEIVKRFCEGKYRTQRRISCNIPILMELNTKSKELMAKLAAAQKAAAKPVATLKKGAKKAKAKAKGKAAPTVAKKDLGIPANIPAKLWFPVIIEDCSVGGIKLRLEKKYVEASGFGKVIEHAASTIKSGDFIQFQLPTWEEIQTGKALGKDWFMVTKAAPTAPAAKAKVAPASKAKAKGKSKAAVKGKAAPAPAAASAPQLMMKPLKSISNKDLLGSALKGKVVWSRGENGDWSIGIQSENSVLSKRLFDAVAELVAAQKAEMDKNKKPEKETSKKLVVPTTQRRPTVFQRGA